jgi:hypothetical protein
LIPHPYTGKINLEDGEREICEIVEEYNNGEVVRESE